MKAFYFSTKERTLRYGDGRSIVVGQTHSVDCQPKVYVQGLHGSVRLIDALQYAPGAILYLVDIDGQIDMGDDKIAGQRRTYLAEFDATELLRKFARQQAMINIALARPYFESEDDYALVVEWLTTGRPQLRKAAESAARLAARSAAWLAAESAARAASRAAAEAAESAARLAAGAAEVANTMLTDMVREATGWNI